MKRLQLLLALVVLGATVPLSVRPAPSAARTASAAPAPVTGGFSPDELRAFAALEPIDTHTHVFESAPAFYAMLRTLHLHIVDICVIDDHGKLQGHLQPQLGDAIKVVRAAEGHASLCTTFDPYAFRQPGFSAAAIRQIDRNFNEGAIAVKIWKNIGMELQDAQGRYVLPDDPVFEPIYRDIAAHHKTLIAHIADPDSLWEPPNPASPDYSYYMEHPEWYMYRKPHPASKEAILKARDHVLEQNPDLRVVGAHLGSMEADFDELSRHLDRYPNFAVDTAARIPYLMLLPRDRAIAFITKYQDRLIYGTDLGFKPGGDPAATVKEWEETDAHDWRFFATRDTLEYQKKRVEGLDLPVPVLHKLYHDNAVRWFPGIASAAP
ncbi:MAG TPA: amidohydrolase family protein [Terriglobia bacterium]|nr:amidohydrolase family protein [Terriglobia bacterium]